MVSPEFPKRLTERCNLYAQKLYDLLAESWEMVTKQDLEKSDGRYKNAPHFATKGSFLYVAYQNESVLYVGETCVSVKKRFTGNGSGAHNKKVWYQRMTHIKYAKASHDDLPEHTRKMLEQALLIALKPGK